MMTIIMIVGASEHYYMVLLSHKNLERLAVTRLCVAGLKHGNCIFSIKCCPLLDDIGYVTFCERRWFAEQPSS